MESSLGLDTGHRPSHRETSAPSKERFPQPPALKAADRNISAPSKPAPPSSATAQQLTHVIVRSSELTDFLFEELQALEDVRVISYPVPVRRPWLNLLRALEVYLLPWLPQSLYLDAAYIAQLRRIRPGDKVLFFALDNRKDLQIIRKFIASRELALWLWNPIRSLRRSALSQWWFFRWLRHADIRAYTFDPVDARDFGLGLTPQVFRHITSDPDAAKDSPRTDVYFVGADKGRLPELRGLESTLQHAGLSTHFHVVADKRRPYAADERAWLQTEKLSYHDNLGQVRRARAIVEILQPGQSGTTLRYVEALFFDKKLITNNRAIREAPGYDPSRFFILGEDDLAGIGQFIDHPPQPVCPRVLARHAIGTWVRQF